MYGDATAFNLKTLRSEIYFTPGIPMPADCCSAGLGLSSRTDFCRSCAGCALFTMQFSALLRIMDGARGILAQKYLQELCMMCIVGAPASDVGGIPRLQTAAVQGCASSSKQPLKPYGYGGRLYLASPISSCQSCAGCALLVLQRLVSQVYHACRLLQCRVVPPQCCSLKRLMSEVFHACRLLQCRVVSPRGCSH
jgi:hypothetical protein